MIKKARDIFYLAPEQASRSRNREELSASDQRSSSPMAARQRSGAPEPLCGNGAAELDRHLSRLAAMIANITEAYSAAIFLADPARRVLRAAGVQTLSRDFLHDAEIGFGCGLIGWTAENLVRISVSPFEHDATTLLYYRSEQELKSFIAVPILAPDENEESLLGVISCDSKKSYAFAKVTEKVLLECAAQAAALIKLVRQSSDIAQEAPPSRNVLQTVLDGLRAHEEEALLLDAAANLPPALIERDALVVVTSPDGVTETGAFYTSKDLGSSAGSSKYAGFPHTGGARTAVSNASASPVQHRLLELVCKHKKIICGERSVHALPVDDIKQRSFLSVPFHVLGKEAGSFNLLSLPRQAFSPDAIEALEAVSRVVGRELERIRLRDRAIHQVEPSGLLSFKQFTAQAESLLGTDTRAPLTLLRVSFGGLSEIERHVGADLTAAVLTRVLRLSDQVVRAPALACSLFGTQVLILAENTEAVRLSMRLRRLIEKLALNDFIANPPPITVSLGDLLSKRLQIVSARYPHDGATVAELTAKTRSLLESATETSLIKGQQLNGEVANAGNW